MPLVLDKKSQVQTEASPVAGEVAQHTDLILLFLHTMGRSRASEVERRGFLRVMRGFYVLLCRGYGSVSYKGTLYLWHICVPLRLVIFG